MSEPVIEVVRPKLTRLERVVMVVAGLMVGSVLWPRPRRLL